MSNQAAIRVGRLLEVRADAGYRSTADVDAIFRQIGQALDGLAPGVRAVAVVDWRRCPLMAGEAAALLARRMEGNNPRVERSVALVPRDAPLQVLQFLSMVRDSHNADRRLFEDAERAVAWLSEVLAPAEVARLREFVAEGAPR